jgi:hypothetical protein
MSPLRRRMIEDMTLRNPQLRPLNFAKFFAPFDHNHPFHRHSGPMA